MVSCFKQFIPGHLCVGCYGNKIRKIVNIHTEFTCNLVQGLCLIEHQRSKFIVERVAQYHIEQGFFKGFIVIRTIGNVNAFGAQPIQHIARSNIISDFFCKLLVNSEV